VIWENGKHGGSAAKIARPVFDYWLLTRKKNPIVPLNHQVSGGLMTAGIKPGELPSGDVSLAADPNALPKPKPNTQTNTATQNRIPTQGHSTTSTQPTPPPVPEADISE